MNKYPNLHLKTALILAVSLMVVIGMLPANETKGIMNVPVSLSIKDIDEPAVVLAAEPVEVQKINLTDWNEITIRPGDSLSAIFSRVGLSATELSDIMALGREVKVLGKILPGQILEFEIDHEGDIKTLRYEETPLKTLVVSRTEAGFSSEWDLYEPEILISYKTAKITAANPSLYHAGKASGLSDNLIMQLSYVFQWDISFALDLRQGDTFTLLYEDIYIEGEKVQEGGILAAQFKNLGKTYTAVLYEDADGRKNYFTPEGRSMRKAFLRDPVHFSHVSSSFNLRRLHPIHNKVMPHRGTDYAAKLGTPVLASGDGKVTIARQNSASGRYVVIRHGEQYATKYLHLSAFAKGIRAGRSVSQGQTIGYVGSTGWATAPHLHYEFLVKGVQRNPRTVKLPKAESISKSDLLKFMQFTQPVLAQLESVTGKMRYALVSKNKLQTQQ